MKISVTKLSDWSENNPNSLLLAMVLLISLLLVLEYFIRSLSRRGREQGLGTVATTIAIDGSEKSPAKDYVSERLGLAGRPDALIKENGFIIPVEHKPLARKIRDRYVAQLLVYMRLIEECEGVKPPYGYLILGKHRRKVKIDNTSEKQKWLQNLVDNMRAITEGIPATPAPHPKKCLKCPVRSHCQHKDTKQATS